MQLPFTVEQFFGAFRAYNLAVWPAQIALLALAVTAVVLLFVPKPWSAIGISLILACLWTWVGLAYHLAFFARINPLAYAFAALSVAAAIIFVWHGVIRRRLEFRWNVSFRTICGLALLVFALLLYPAWSSLSGHNYPAFPTFGLPCPTTIFTIGVFGFAAAPYPRSPIVIPVLWCFVGAQAAFLLGVHADLGLIGACLVGMLLLAKSRVSAFRMEPESKG